MRIVLIALLTLVVYQAPVPTFIAVDGFACVSIQHWLDYDEAVTKRDGNHIRNTRLAQRCVDVGPTQIEVLERTDNFILYEGNARRRMYIPDWYLLE